MKFRDLKRQYQLHKEQIDKAVAGVLQRADFIQGGMVTQLEEMLADYAGVKYCITCANGTDALQLALMAWGVGPGDAVFVPDFTFFSSGEAVSAVRAVPVFADVDADTFNICPQSLEAAVEYVLQNTELNPRAIVAVDLFGQPAEFREIRRIADRYGLLILEDAAQGFGGKIGERRGCSFGDIATTSFFPAKPLGCYGDGGAVFTDNEEWADLIRSCCVHGKGSDKYDNVRIGMNSRLDTIQAAVLLEKLKFFDEEIEKCSGTAKEYTRLLKDVVKAPVIKKGMRSVWAQYTVCFDSSRERKIVMEKLKELHIPTAIYYKKPMHLQKAFQPYDMRAAAYQNTESICRTCLSLPMHPYLSTDEVAGIADAVIESLEGRNRKYE